MTSYDFNINDVDITVFDTPRLAEGTRKDEEHLQEIKEKVTAFDVFIFCTEMDTERFRDDDINTTQKLTEAFGSQLWEHAVVALTFANRVRPPFSKKDMKEQDFFDQRYRMFKKKIKNVIKEVGVADEVLSFVPFVAATGDLSEPRLRGIHNWVNAFWIATFKRLNRSAIPAFLIANINHFNRNASPDHEVPRNRSRRSIPSGEQREENNFMGEYNGDVSRDSNSTIAIRTMPMIFTRVKVTADHLLGAFLWQRQVNLQTQSQNQIRWGVGKVQQTLHLHLTWMRHLPKSFSRRFYIWCVQNLLA